MKCGEFTLALSTYLKGDLAEPAFGQMVEHEASCAMCRRQAAEYSLRLKNADVTGDSADDVIGGELGTGFGNQHGSAYGTGTGGFLSSILKRTSGADCAWVGMRMAEAMDDALPSDVLRIVQGHVGTCRSCQRLREQLNALPYYYESFPVLHAGRKFTESILVQTIGARPGFVEVIRTIWKSPGGMWESVMACTVAAVFLFGSFVPEFETVVEPLRGVAQSVQEASVLHQNSLVSTEPRPSLFRRCSTSAAAAWRGMESGAIGVSEWAEQTAVDLRRQDFPSLLEDVRMVLEPLGLYPSAEDGLETEIETDASSREEPGVDYDPGEQPRDNTLEER